MNKPIENPCVRCGQERRVVRTWKEKMGNSVIINVETACPNKACQKIVETENKKQHDKYMMLRLRSEQRAAERKATKDAIRAAKLAAH